VVYEDKGRYEESFDNTDTALVGMTRQDPCRFGEEYEKD
jgi:hypothetical protein